MTASAEVGDASSAGGACSVLVVAQGAPEIGGIPTFVDGMLRPGFLPAGITIEYLNTTRVGSQRTGAGSPSAANVRKTLADAWRTFVSARGVDIVHLHTSPLPMGPLLRAVAISAAGRLAGAAVVCHMHASFEPRAGSFSPSGRYLAGLQLLRVATVGVAVSSQAAQFLAGHVPRWPVTTIHNAVDTDAFDTADPRGKPPALLFVGRIMVGKGLLDLVRALEIASERGVKFRTTLVGSAPTTGAEDLATVARAVEMCGLDITMAGAKTSPGVREALAEADIFVLPSHFEGQPISVLEAMAAGLPVVATDVGANSAVVRDGVDGLVVAPHDPPRLADALVRLAASPDLRAEMGQSGQHRAAESFGLERLSRDLTDIYQRALARRHRRRTRGSALWDSVRPRSQSGQVEQRDAAGVPTRRGSIDDRCADRQLRGG